MGAHTNPRSLLASERGTALTEFGLIAPTFAMLLMGTLDIAHSLYMQAVLQGTVQKAARDGSLETGSANSAQTTIDTRIRTAVKKLNTSMTDSNIIVARRYYKTFSSAYGAQAETYTDTNTNNTCDNGEPYTDANNNSTWDRDGGNSGQGGARDITVYTVTVSYPHMFPLWKMLGTSANNTVRATTVLANQPYGAQSQYGTATARNCP
ncbi:MAG: pilus assembly protein [Sphingobium sp.]|nr:pilus assembly protein [Sphingobium sp.]MBP6111818.1 pilus assembly protein [Sphingobium sp.]MBP8669916.1 pilus assembly protein [Sphingobium sp.]MBP9157848.1 pilus assembly protein [Sphingobium sp.]MCC6482406.1 pilus assembly protein [Sphingomonadaceae bacterium]